MNNKLFSKITAVIAVVLMTIAAPAAKAQLNYPDNFLCAWGGLGYANLFHQAPYVTSLGGPGALLGVGYEVKKKNFIFNVGFEFDWKNTFSKREDFIVDVNMTDTEGEDFVYSYNFTKFNDNYNVGYVNLPVRLGARFRSFYFLVGAKVGLNLFATSNSWARIHTYGTYPWSIVPFENQPDHFFLDKKLSGSNSFKTDLNVAATLEMGWSIYPGNRKAKHYYRVGFFADYGLFNIHMNADEGNVIGIPSGGNTDVTDVKLNSLFTSNQFLDKNVNPAMIGCRFTVLWHVGERHTCNCYIPYHTKWERQNEKGYPNTHHISEFKTKKANNNKKYKR